ncbi:MAG TPA: HAMP domain-containing sensor histidine kinase [Stenomitos sp.]
MELIFLLLGAGLGFLGSRITRSVQPPVTSTPSLPQKTPTDDVPSAKASIEPVLEEVKPLLNKIEPLKEEQQPILNKIEPLKEEHKPVEANAEPLEEQLKQTQLAYLMAKEMSQFKGGFLARTAHELRSPLSSLIGMHQLILSDLCDSPEEAREFVAQANTSALKMVKILDEVITVSKIEQGSNRLEILSLPLTQVFEEVQGLTHMQAANSNLQFEVVPPDPELYVLADPRRFRQVLMGIVDTAITKLADLKEGSIKISGSSAPDAQEVRIWIDVQTPTSAWSEVVDLLSTTPEMEKPPIQTAELSPGLTLLMAQTLVEVMQGKLEVLPVSDEELAATSATDNFIRLQCSMPLAIPEPVEQALA